MDIAEGSRRATQVNLRAAMHHNRLLSIRGLQERLFTFAFSGLVYAQIWEDPVLDMEALQLREGETVVAIASGGCNGMSYLTARPAKVTLVDLNAHHIALNKLKKLAATALPDHEAFFSFFGRADSRTNLDLYDRFLRARLDEASRRHWDGRDWRGRRRITYFTDNLYRHGLLGLFIAAGHLVARLHGVRLETLLEARTLEEQRERFERDIRPVFETRHMRWVVDRPSSLYGLGIPPAQYDALLSSAAPGKGMASVLEARIERLICDFPFSENYFAWQAFARRYQQDGGGSLPPYLMPDNFETLQAMAPHLDVRHVNFVDHLKQQDPSSLDCYVLLDAQDWMTDAGLNALWSEITRTAKPGARVIFRTAGDETILPGRVASSILSRWSYDREACRAFTSRDRSSIYGGFHLYTLNA